MNFTAAHKFWTKKVLALTLSAAVLYGCAATSPSRDGATAWGAETRAAIESALESASASPVHAPSPAAVDDLNSRQAGDFRFDVNCDRTPAQAFFRALVDQTPHNLVVHPDVDGNISLMLKDVTVAEVLAVVSEVYGYSYRQTVAGYAIFPATLQSRIFQIDYLNLQRFGVSRMRVSSGQVSESGNNNRAGGSLASTSGNGSRSRDSQQLSGSRIETNYEADFWSELQSTLESMLGGAKGHQIIVNSQTGVIVVRALPDVLHTIGEYLETVQEIAQRQVIIEAKIIEVELRDGYQAGVNWAAVAQTSKGHTFSFGQLAPPAGFGGDPSDLGGTPITVSPGTPTTGFEGTSVGGAMTMAFDISDFNSFIELLEVQGETRVLSSPRVSTLNNQKAVIKAGTDEFFVTDIASNTVTGTSSSTSSNVQLTPFFSGVALDVTPQISADGQVTLHIHPTVSEVTDQIKNLTVSGQTDTLPLAVSVIRESDSIVKARSGQIIVIGGLMRSSSTDESFGTPVISKIPGIGRLFKSTRTVERKTELVILLRPIVVDNDVVWAEMASEALDRIQNGGNRQGPDR